MEYVEFPAKYQYDEGYLPTPRCRKLRYRTLQGESVVEIPVYKLSDAPVAFEHSEDCSEREYLRQYRLAGGKLLARVRNYDMVCLGDSDAPGWASVEMLARHLLHRDSYRTFLTSDWKRIADKAEIKKNIRKKTGGYAIMVTDDGEQQVWHSVGEPRYCIYTFGLGHNHAGIGTSLSIVNSYNENISKNCYFTALQYEEALAEALRVAAARGDTHSFDFIRREPKIEVFLPEAVKCNPAKEAGDGCDFLNSVEALIETTGSATEAGLLTMCMAVAQK